MDPRATAGWGHRPRHSRQGHGVAIASLWGHWESCSEEAAVLWDCLGISLPGAEKVQQLQAGTRCKECSQELQVKLFCVRNCQVKVKCFSCSPAAEILKTGAKAKLDSVK